MQNIQNPSKYQNSKIPWINSCQSHRKQYVGKSHQKDKKKQAKYDFEAA